MSNILIDAYNLIGLAHENLEKARADLIAQLRQYAEITNHFITVVFDGWKDGSKDESRSTSRNLTVIYSRLGENADSVIKKIVASGAKSWIVVSSDREVSDYAANKDHAAIAAHEFEEKLFATIGRTSNSEKENGILYEDDDEISGIKKGNPRKLSKRERIKLRALNKL